MSDGALSQDEIEALLQGADQAFGELENLSPTAINTDKDLIDIAKVIADNQGSSLTSITTKNSKITYSNLTIGNSDDLQKTLGGKYVEAVVSYNSDLRGNIHYYLKESDSLTLATLMMGQEETDLTDMVAQVLNEAFSQMTGVANSAIGARYSANIENMPIDTHILGDGSEASFDGKIAIVEAKLSVEGSIESSPFVFVFDSAMIDSISSIAKPKQTAATSASSNTTPNQSSTPSVGIQHADFGNLHEAIDVHGTGNIGLLMDVTMNLTVELGRATMTIKNILSLGEGSIIKLQKLAGEPVDLLVNGKLIARGEVVVIDENFGVRVTDIMNPLDRLGSKPF